MDQKYHADILKKINEIEKEMVQARIDYTETVLNLKGLYNENIVLQNRELNDELVQ